MSSLGKDKDKEILTEIGFTELQKSQMEDIVARQFKLPRDDYIKVGNRTSTVFDAEALYTANSGTNKYYRLGAPILVHSLCATTSLSLTVLPTAYSTYAVLGILINLDLSETNADSGSGQFYITDNSTQDRVFPRKTVVTGNANTNFAVNTSGLRKDVLFQSIIRVAGNVTPPAPISGLTQTQQLEMILSQGTILALHADAAANPAFNGATLDYETQIIFNYTPIRFRP